MLIATRERRFNSESRGARRKLRVMCRSHASDPPVMSATCAPTAPGWARRLIRLANATVRTRVARATVLGLLATNLASFGSRANSLEADTFPSEVWPQSPIAPAGVALGDETYGAITGRVTAAVGGRVPEMVVYLEAVDPRKTPAAPPGPAFISQKGAQFSPSLLVICAGQQVRFLNDEDRPVEHNVFSKSPAKPFDLGLFSAGASKLVTFDRPGIVSLHCSIHQKMDGVIFVAPTPFFARVDRTGGYTIAGVPPGEYRLRTWQRVRRFNEHTRLLTVADRSAITVDIALSRDP